MDKCPNCKKNAVENDICLSCGIVVSKWLKLHSVAPPEKSERKEEPKPVYPYGPPETETKEKPDEAGSKRTTDDAPISDLSPPDFLLDKDATMPISDDLPPPSIPPGERREDSGAGASGSEEKAGRLPEDRVARTAEPMERQQPRAHVEAENKEQQRNSFFAETADEVMKLRRDLKTDWEEHYKTHKGRFTVGDEKTNLENNFKIRNILISAVTIFAGILALDVKFFLRFGITTEYFMLQPLISFLSLIAISIGLGSIFTLKFKDIKVKRTESGKIKMPLHFVQIIEIVLIVILLLLVPLRPTFDVSDKSDFPILADSEMEIEFLTGEGIGSFYRPVLAEDGKSIYAIHLYGQSSGFIVRIYEGNRYETVVKGIRANKFRFLSKNEIIFRDSSGLHKLLLTKGLKGEHEYDLMDVDTLGISKYRPGDFDLSDDGGKILFCSRGDIYLSERPFEDAENLTETDDLREVMPAFYPNGNGFLFIRDMTHHEKDAMVNTGVDVTEEFDREAIIEADSHYQLFKYNLLENREQRMTEDSYNYYYPLYSEDMNSIAAVVEVPATGMDPTMGCLTFNERAVILMKSDGSGKYRIFPPLNMPLRAMHEMWWYGDSKRLLIGINALLQKGIYRVSL